MKYCELFQYLHDINFNDKLKINNYLLKKTNNIHNSKIKNKIINLRNDKMKYLQRMWFVGWEVSSGVVWKNYKNLKLQLTTKK
jgi:hypothetical protein